MYPQWRPSPRRPGDSAPGRPAGSTRRRLAGRRRNGRMAASAGPSDSIESCTAFRFHGADMDLRPKRYADTVVLDFAGVEYISSVGLRVLMLASKQAKSQRGALGIAALQPAVREIFDISRFTMVLDVFPSVREGLARLSPKALAAFDAA